MPEEELMPFDLPADKGSIIKVLGVGGGGSNAVNHMFEQGIQDVNFVVCNTDSQALDNSPVPIKIQLGESLTEGRGAGNKPERGRQAAIENLDDVLKGLGTNTKMVFVTAGMGGGTGTGAAPIIAKATKDLGILTVGIVTIPFRFEGERRIKQAIQGITELHKHVDSLLVINNERLREIYGDLKVREAFARADDVLTVAAKGIAEIITVHGHLNVDFADVQTVMTNSGVALMGQAQASGEGRALKAIKDALSSPLLNSSDIHGAKDILLNISSGAEEATMDEISQINEYVQEAAGFTADLIWGNTANPKLGDNISVTVIATGFETDIIPEVFAEQADDKTVHQLRQDKAKEDKSQNETNVVFLDPTDSEDQEEGFETLKTQTHDTKEDQTQPQLQDNEEDFFSLDDDDLFGLGDEQEKQKTPPHTQNEAHTKNETEKTHQNQTIESLQAQQYKNSKPDYKRSSYKENIEDLENVPAYQRKKLNIEEMQQQHSKQKKSAESKTKVSKFSLSDDEDEPELRSDNAYLHDRAD